MEHIFYESQFGEDWFTYQKLYFDMVKKFPSGSYFVEVGSWKGKSSSFMAVEIINSNKNIKFDCVDTWLGGPEYSGIDVSNLYETFITNMIPVQKYYNAIKETSSNASKLYKNESLDFIFIDACHKYECVKEDILSWFPKLKKGGIIAGHDYDDFRVRQAVDEFFGKNIIERERCWVYEN